MAVFTNAKRILKAGFINFWRNGVVSLASILVFTITLSVIGGVVLGSAVFDAALTQLKRQVDITVYFSIDAEESDIVRVRDRVERLDAVEEVEYVSREEVLAEFTEAHKDEPVTLQSIEEVGDNPLRAELNVRAADPSQYSSIVRSIDSDAVLSQSSGNSVIDKINYDDNKEAIDRFTSVTGTAEQLGFYLSIVTAAIAVLVAFNTIRLAIYTAREEIAVMRLVGASDNYIRGPFIIEGIMYGIISGLFAMALFYPVTSWLSQVTNDFYQAIDLFDYYITNIVAISAIVIGSGVILGVISSWLAVRRYLDV